MSYENLTIPLQVDSSKNSFVSIEPVPVKNMFGMTEMRDTKLESYIFASDYTTYMAGMGCVEGLDFWNPKPTVFFFIAVRDRSFDSLKTLGLIGAQAPFAVDQNTVVFPYSGPNCKN